jgi:hypothetical protein
MVERIRVRLILLAVAGSVACAGAGQTPSPPGPDTVSRIYIPGGSGTEMHNEAGRAARFVLAPLDSVWLALPGVYEILGIPEAGAAPDEKLFGNTGFRARRIDGKRLSVYLDCGSGATAVPRADNYEVTLSVLTGLSQPATGGTMVLTTVDGTAKPRTRAGNPVHCASEGTLELRLWELLVEALQGG